MYVELRSELGLHGQGIRHTRPNIIQDTEDDEGAGDERDIWEVTHVTEEDVETTEGETALCHDPCLSSHHTEIHI